MANKLYEEASVQAIANAIRSKNGTTTKYKIGEMAAAIEAISTGEDFGRVVICGSITPAENITSDYTVTHKHIPTDGPNSVSPNLFMFKDVDSGDVPYSWVWLVMGSYKHRQGFNYGKYFSSNGSLYTADYGAAVGSVEEGKFTISCDSTKMLLAGHTYFWVAIQNSNFS